MRYNGNICDGCNEPLNENEDIVVCPECATPQHRHCYDKENKCVNAHLHGTDFIWQGSVDNIASVKTSTLVSQEEKGDELICPNCHHSNPAGSEVCRQCGMKFTMFGINVVESMKQQQEQNIHNDIQGGNIPEYKAPFTVGEGEGFEHHNEEAAGKQEDRSQAPIIGSEEFFNDEANIFKGPYPADDFTCGVKTNSIGAFVRNNAQTYIEKMKRSELKGRNSFNWAAFFFAPYWFFYRRLYKPGIIMLTVQLCISILTAPSMNKLLTVYQSFVENLETMSDAVLAESMTQLQSLMMPAVIVSVATFVMHIISGFIANRLYKNYIVKNIKYAMTLATVRERITHFAKNGGASMIAVLVAYLAETGLSYLASYLMY
jgi:ribosomal protein L40E